ncbi:purine-nucleoside phosphorylase [Pseudoxanthomonas winnipegensis]|jgi:purine nucleoside permease|uniref:Purine nucleoside permease n=1 Tax=Pseudoxanthomonas winnipegensis TaxID=2480810 RepID=A0A4Q8LH79_9GAMM|nr:purine nucleoside permease [Pseudoxanthomonas winnipegensis]TAA28569.1 purine nucleoside permease [Pseudoxanthomonas winnipegensis]
MFRSLSKFLLPALLGLCATPAFAQKPLAPKVLVITMFAPEAAPWREAERFQTKVPVPGLSPRYPTVDCTPAGLCLMTTDMGLANAASSVAALVASPRFDLRRTYVLIAGICGVAPEQGTLGSAHWARFAIDGGLMRAVDPRQQPAGWSSNLLMLGATAPGQQVEHRTGTEVFQLDETLLQKAYALSAGVALEDSDAAAAYRLQYPQPAARAAPAVSICDSLTSDTYWHGSLIATAMEAYVQLTTDGRGRYCITQMEDNATLTALKRGAEAGRLQFDRIALLRTASNFDREAPGQDVGVSLSAKSGGFLPSTHNAYRVGHALTEAILTHWEAWSHGVPKE